MITNNFRKILMLIFSSQASNTWAPFITYGGVLTQLVSIYGEEKQVLASHESTATEVFNSLINTMNHISTSSSNSVLYLKVGTGTIPPTADDFQLNYIEDNIPCDSAVVGNSANNTKTYTATFSNPTNSDITITEMGLYGKIMYYNDGTTGEIYYDDFLLDRTVLSTPITIPAGESKAITYELGF